MSSFAGLAKRIILANRIKKKFESRVERSTRPVTSTSLAPLSPTLIARIPQELFERIIDHLYDDVSALLSCCVVCRAWVPASRYHLFGRLVVRPLVLTPERFRVNCAVFFRESCDDWHTKSHAEKICKEGRKYILYGADHGIYISGLAPYSSPKQVLTMPDPVTQIDVLDSQGLVVFLSAHRIMTIPLRILNPAASRDSSSCMRISSHATFFKVGAISGRDLVCVVKAGLSTTCKLLAPVVTPSSQVFSLQLYKEFYVSERVTSIHFLRTKLVAGTSRHDFEVIDVETLVTQPLLDPSVDLPESKSPPKCLAVFRVDCEVLLCYNCFAIYVDTQGRLLERNAIRWRSNTIQAVALREPYLIAFGADHIEIRYAQSGALVQTIRIGYTLLSILPELFMVQALDGRLLGLRFAD